MNILYVHGFGSNFYPESQKTIMLEELGTVYGVSIDYTQGFSTVLEQLENAVAEYEIDLVIGTSMGGYMAAEVSRELGIMFIAFNPATRPRESLQEHAGDGLTYQGLNYHLSQETINDFPDMTNQGIGMMFLERGDDVIDYRETLINVDYPVRIFQGGSHRFENVQGAVPYIENFYNTNVVSLGFGDN